MSLASVGTLVVAALHLAQGLESFQAQSFASMNKPQRALLAPRDFGEQPFRPPQGMTKGTIHVTINHLAKAGGTFVHDIVEKSLPRDRLNWEREGDSITDFESKANFVIGMVRNPFNYYVSLWAYTSDGRHCCFRNSIPLELQNRVFSQEKVLGSTWEDRQRFRHWLRLISTPQLGLMSMRFFGSYLNNGNDTFLGNQQDFARAANDWEKGSVPWVLEMRARKMLGFPTSPLPGLMRPSDREGFEQLWKHPGMPPVELRRREHWIMDAIHMKMQNLTTTIVHELPKLLWRMQTANEFADRAVNCWMYTERIVPDLKSCLERYENAAKAFEHNGPVVDWQRFHAEVREANHNQALPHVNCEDFYDEDTRQFVLHSDAALFKAFGYAGHCA